MQPIPNNNQPLTLFNTILSSDLAPSIPRRHRFSASQIKYPILPKDLPTIFDPRDPKLVPPEVVKYWFYKDSKEHLESILSYSLQQSSCGSCWAFSTATQFSDVIRLNLTQRYGETACNKSIFFQPSFVCTGESNVSKKSSGGVVNVDDLGVYGWEVMNQISSYFTVSFAPKSTSTGAINASCNKVLAEWKETMSKKNRKPKQFAEVLQREFSNCMGCQGNFIENALMLYSGSVEEAPGVPAGAPLLVDFTLHDWACLWAGPQLRSKFCSEKFLSGDLVFDFPKLYHCDNYSYLKAGLPLPAGITNMIDCMKCAIYNFGTITIGYSVFDSFLKFFQNPKNATQIYTAKQMIYDLTQGGMSKTPKGGHAVVIVGWAQTPPDKSGKVTKYWIVRNSWGQKWADRGFFKVEQGMDPILRAAGLPPMKFESEFGSIYYDKDNKMETYLLKTPTYTCPAFETHPDYTILMNNSCKCRCGEKWDTNQNKCVPVPGYGIPDAPALVSGFGALGGGDGDEDENIRFGVSERVDDPFKTTAMSTNVAGVSATESGDVTTTASASSNFAGAGAPAALKLESKSKSDSTFKTKFSWTIIAIILLIAFIIIIGFLVSKFQHVENMKDVESIDRYEKHERCEKHQKM